VEHIARHDAAYPPALTELADPPPRLWWIGDRSLLDGPLVTIVGTRRATSYGLRVTREIASALARAGACVVSGMALGIDAAAHRAALDAGGTTIAVLGTGADVAYPRAHVALHREIIERGLVLSELPPGAHSHGGSFPNRNRILAGLSKVTIVVEAPFGSGALITARHANDLGRDVGIVPGPIDSPQSQGSNLLMRDGAHPIVDVADALGLAGLAPHPRAEPRVDDEIEMRVWAALAHGSATLDEICARAGLPVAQCLSAVTGLELRGAVECALTGEVRRR
jgi:DNA processing protein